MIQITQFEILPNMSRIAAVVIKYYDLHICCDLCLYQEDHLWIRMPEIWLSDDRKKRFVFWETTQHSDDFQKIILDKIFRLVGLDLAEAIQIKKNYMLERKTRKQPKQ